MRSLVIAIAVAAATPGLARASAPTLVPDATHPGVGTTLTVDVRVPGLELSCFTFSVDYDPAVLDYLGATEGPLFTGAPELTFFSDDLDGMGRPQPNGCLLGFGTSVSGPGTIAQLSFLVLDDSETTVALRDPVLRDVDRLPLPEVSESMVSINASTTANPAARGFGELLAQPNPSSSRLSLVLSGRPSLQGGRVFIFDLSGRLVRELDWPAGTQSRGWDGFDHSGRSVANGIYHARYESGSRRAQTRIVRVR